MLHPVIFRIAATMQHKNARDSCFIAITYAILKV